MATINEDLLPAFDVPSFYEVFLTLNQKYNELEFTDEISDSERIAEYKWISEQLRRYINKQKPVILGHNDKEDMLHEIENLISKNDDYGNTRKEIVYNIIRDEWLLNLHRVVYFYQDVEE